MAETETPPDVKALAESYAGKMADVLMGRGGSMLQLLAEAIMADRAANPRLVINKERPAPFVIEDDVDHAARPPGPSRDGVVIAAEDLAWLKSVLAPHDNRDSYWQMAVDEIEAAGRGFRYARLTNHHATYLLKMAGIVRRAALSAIEAAK